MRRLEGLSEILVTNGVGQGGDRAARRQAARRWGFVGFFSRPVRPTATGMSPVRWAGALGLAMARPLRGEGLSRGAARLRCVVQDDNDGSARRRGNAGTTGNHARAEGVTGSHTTKFSNDTQLSSKKQTTCLQSRVLCSQRVGLSIHTRNVALEIFKRACSTVSGEAGLVSADQQEVGTSSSSFMDFTVITNINENGEVKLKIEVSSSKTQVVFDGVFSKLVAAAQPIPGFRRVKGGKTPDIPKDILLHMLGPSKVNKQTIKKIIHTTVSEYVEKESLKVAKDLKVEQSLEELEAIFEPGKEFSFNAVFQLLEKR